MAELNLSEDAIIIGLYYSLRHILFSQCNRPIKQIKLIRILYSFQDESSHTSEIESQSVENDTPTAVEINERRSDNVESKNAETTALPTLQPVLKSENDDYESDNASNSDIAETRNQSNDEYDSEEQTIINSSKNMETTEIDKQEDRSGKSKKHTNKNKAKPVVDDDSSESTSDRSEQSVDSSEEESSELDLATPQNTRRMNSYPDVKAGQNLGIIIGYKVQVYKSRYKYFNSQHIPIYVR